jgi:hypothetical protein
MRTSETFSFNQLNPIDAASCFVMTAYQLCKDNNKSNLTVLCASENLTEIELSCAAVKTNIDLLGLETILQGVFLFCSELL